MTQTTGMLFALYLVAALQPQSEGSRIRVEVAEQPDAPVSLALVLEESSTDLDGATPPPARPQPIAFQNRLSKRGQCASGCVVAISGPATRTVTAVRIGTVVDQSAGRFALSPHLLMPMNNAERFEDGIIASVFFSVPKIPPARKVWLYLAEVRFTNRSTWSIPDRAMANQLVSHQQ